MPLYKAPLDDIRFLLFELLDIENQADLPGMFGLERDVIDAVLDGGARICEDVLQPLNQSGDAEGCHWDNGEVRVPEGFKQAYDRYVEGGWHVLGFDPEWGGQGLPSVLGLAMTEMTVSANHALSTYFGLSSAAMGAIRGFASPEMKARYLPPMVAGRWTGTMNLTEPHCGTDLRLLRTQAVSEADGSYRITGTKIFITAGEHDLGENIIHMVLAKIPGEGEGLGQVNLFLVPKFLVNDDGSLGARNGVTCGSIENKMGIRGSATAVLHYEDAVGYRIGGERATKAGGGKGTAGGMAGMFAMMNAARLGVGLQGMALSEVAYQNAAAYARERLAGRALTGAKHPELPADPIIVHADVRRMLMHIRSFTEGARALALFVSMEMAKSNRVADAEARQQAREFAMLLTPMIKAFFTDMGFDCVNQALQCFGGHGYIKDHGMEQFVRDARILQLYEGANGVQALDVVGRRLPANGGQSVRDLFALINGFIDDNKDSETLAPYVDALARGLSDLTAATVWLAQNGPGDRDNAGAGSTDYLRLLAIVVFGYMWCQMARTASAKLAAGDGDRGRSFYEMKLLSADYWMQRMMPETGALKTKIAAGAKALMAAPAEAF
jgi:hypothetical protein